MVASVVQFKPLIVSFTILILVSTLSFGATAVAQAAHVEPASPLETENESASESPASKTNEVVPAPPLSKAYMGAPLELFDEDGDLQFLSTTEKWIDVDLSEQKVIAFEGLRPVRSFIISSGLPRTPTVEGTFRIRAKVRSQVMSGPGYYLPNVEWVQYFYRDYAFHGTYWHNNFGNPMSHGCINMTNADAQWLFEWASPEWNGDTWMHVAPDQGTLVTVHQ